MAQPYDLTIIILSYNSQFWLKKTLDTLKAFYLRRSKLQIKVVVVDNHSSDESVAMVQKQFKWVELKELEDNFGFAKGNNQALAEVNSRYVMLLNSDVESTTETKLDQLIAYMDENPKVGVVTPKVQLNDGSLDWASHRGEPSLWASFTYFVGLEKIFPTSAVFGQYHQAYQDLRNIHEIDACSGAAMIVRTSAMKKVGFLDEQFFMYAEDLDWCKRFREAGYKVMFHPAATVIHHKYKSGLSGSTHQVQRKTTGYFYDTMLQYYDKHYRAQYPAWVRTIIKYLLTLKKGGL
ncbi:MAG TPA: glycosyltransferase family 2 protein [Vitreimonas sp.]|nr:glycosyltransferase family 2 protein [Vitreimonas sp.]